MPKCECNSGHPVVLTMHYSLTPDNSPRHSLTCYWWPELLSPAPPPTAPCAHTAPRSRTLHVCELVTSQVNNQCNHKHKINAITKHKTREMKLNQDVSVTRQEVNSSIINSVIVSFHELSIFTLLIGVGLILTICLIVFRHIRVGRVSVFLGQQLRTLQDTALQAQRHGPGSGQS